MKTQIPVDIESDLRDKVACGDYRPVNADTGPTTDAEWLALIEDEIEIQEDNVQNNRGNDAAVFQAYADALKRLAKEIRAEGVLPVKFHWEDSSAAPAR